MWATCWGAGLHGAALGSAKALSAGTRHPGPLGAGGHGAAHAGHGVALAMGLGGIAVRCQGWPVRWCCSILPWCMLRLVALGATALGGLIFSGPGLGIALTGLSASAMVAWHWPAAAGWAVFGLLCVGLCALVWPVVQGSAAGGCSQLHAMPTLRPGARSAQRAHAGLWFGGAGLHRHRHVFAGDCACCLACWLGVARLVLASVWHGCGHGGRPVPRAPGGVG